MKTLDPWKIVIGLAGGLTLGLGGLWLLQGSGLVHVRPILCFAECTEIQEPSMTWTIIGLVTAAAGAWGLIHGLRNLRTVSPR